MVIHRLTQQPDGDLRLSLPEGKKGLFDFVAKNEIRSLTQGWEIEENRYKATESERQQMLLMQALPERFYLKTEIKMGDAVQAGVILEADGTFGEGYYVYLEPERGRLAFRSWIRMHEEGGKAFPYDVELETPVRPSEDGRYLLEILREGSAATAYVNKEAALSFRMYDYKGRGLGLFAFGRAEFQNTEMRTKNIKKERKKYDQPDTMGSAQI